MSAPAFGSLGTLLGTSTASPAFAVPSSVAADDIIVVAAYIDSTATVTALPSGFAHASGSPRTVAAGSGFGEHTLLVAWKRATGGDTGTYTFTLSASTFVYGNAVRFTGAISSGDPWDATAAADGGAVNISTAPAVSLTTLGPDRLLIYAATDHNGDGGTWTASAAFNQRQGGTNATNCEISDLAQASAGGTGNVSATTTAAGRMGAWLGALIGTTVAGSIPPPPARTVPIRDLGEAWWIQRDRRDANTVATAANPLPSPLDVAFGAGGPIWWQRGGAVDAAPRTWQPQQRSYADPSLLTPAAAMPVPAPQRTVQARDYGEAQWLQPARRDVGLLATALLEDVLLGGAETITRVTSPVTNAPRWWMPQQPARQGYTPGLLDSAELEGPLLAGDIRRHGHVAIYVDRREMPQQRLYISDPSFYPTVTPTDPLTLAYGAGGTYWLLYNEAALYVSRREVPQQRAYVSDPALLGTALLEDALLGGGDTGRHQTWYVDRREVPQQRAYISDPSTYPLPGVTDPLTLAYGAGGVYWTLYNSAALQVGRREIAQQRRYQSDPSLLASAQLEDVLLGSAGTVRHLTWHTDRREVPQQRVYTDPAELSFALLEGVLLGGGDTARHAFFITDRRLMPQQPPRMVFAGSELADPLILGAERWRRAITPATHTDRRVTVPQRIALVFVGVPAPDVVKAESSDSVTARRTSTDAVTARRTSIDAVTARRTSGGGVT